MNPIFVEYYTHENADCYKINLPWTRYKSHTMVLCKVSEGYEKAVNLAREEIRKHFDEVVGLPLSPKGSRIISSIQMESDLHST